MKLIITVLVCFIQYASIAYCQSWLPTKWEGTVAMIEKLQITNNDTAYIPFGTGFFYRDTSISKTIFFITNKHILKNKDAIAIKSSDNIFIIGSLKTDRLVVPLATKETLNWFCHYDSTYDLAAINLLVTNSGTTIIPRLWEGERVIPLDSIIIGTESFFLGFPMGISTINTSNSKFNTIPLVRGGIISYICKGITFIGGNAIPDNIIIVDGVSIGGNSGSPLFTKSTKKPYKARLAGIIYGHIGAPQSIKSLIPPDTIICKSDTIIIKRDSINIDIVENSGLAKAVPAIYISQMLRNYESMQK